MFEKMCQVDPSAPTPEEIQVGGVTKPRYMVWRETISSTAAFGFRIEGIRKHDGTSSKDYKTVGTAPQILTVLEDFIKDRPHALVIQRLACSVRMSLQSFSSMICRLRCRAGQLKYIERLGQLETTLASSEFFANHEVSQTRHSTFKWYVKLHWCLISFQIYLSFFLLFFLFLFNQLFL